MDKIRQLQDMINESNRIVFFGGAGVSTESNIPDFQECRRTLQTKVPLLTGADCKPQLFHAAYGRIL